MKIKHIAPHIYKIEAWVGLKISTWLVKTEFGSILIDSGMGFMTGATIKLAKAYGPLQMILLTHGHIDHTGGLASLLKKERVPVYAHELEIPYMEGDLAYPGRRKPQRLVDKGVVKPLPKDREGQLHSMMGLIPYYTPGHSPGHTVYYHPEDQLLLCGDLFTSKNGRLKPPIKAFTADMAEAVESGKIVEELSPAAASVCHGGEVSDPGRQYKKYKATFGSLSGQQ
ncbi:MBL fold metallo-hydrolase [Salibacterium aidingense]|uniref:MBL fold metallo-hydrolase n=1 Tax=Salibacterium aidingense TaxID=384933 RepID=UPI003BEAFE94